MAPALAMRVVEDWSEIETLLTATPSTAVASTLTRSSRMWPLLSAAVVVVAASAAAIPAVRALYQGTPAEVPVIAADPTPFGHAVQDVAGSETAPSLTEGRSAAETKDDSSMMPGAPPRHRKHHTVQ